MLRRWWACTPAETVGVWSMSPIDFLAVILPPLYSICTDGYRVSAMLHWLSPVWPLIPIADFITCMFYKAVCPWLLCTCGGLLLLFSPMTTLDKRWPPSAVVTALFVVDATVEIALTDPKFISLILQTGPPDFRCK